MTVEAVPFFFFAADVGPAIGGGASVISAVSVEGKGVEDLNGGMVSEKGGIGEFTALSLLISSSISSNRGSMM